MAAPSYVNNGGVSTGSGTTVTPALPASRSNGNLLIAFGTWRGTSGTVSCSTSGWTKLAQQTAGSSTTGLIFGVFYRFVDGSESAPAIVYGTSATFGGLVIQYSGTDQSSPFATPVGAGVTASPIVIGSITTTRANSRALYIVATRSATAVSTPTNYTENVDTVTSGGFATGDQAIASSGTSTGSISMTGPAVMGGIHVELLSPATSARSFSTIF